MAILLNPPYNIRHIGLLQRSYESAALIDFVPRSVTYNKKRELTCSLIRYSHCKYSKSFGKQSMVEGRSCQIGLWYSVWSNLRFFVFGEHVGSSPFDSDLNPFWLLRLPT